MMYVLYAMEMLDPSAGFRQRLEHIQTQLNQIEIRLNQIADELAAIQKKLNDIEAKLKELQDRLSPTKKLRNYDISVWLGDPPPIQLVLKLDDLFRTYSQYYREHGDAVVPVLCINTTCLDKLRKGNEILNGAVSMLDIVSFEAPGFIGQAVAQESPLKTFAKHILKIELRNDSPSYIPVVCFNEADIYEQCKAKFKHYMNEGLNAVPEYMKGVFEENDAAMQELVIGMLFRRIDNLMKADLFLFASDLVRIFMLTILERGFYNDVDLRQKTPLTPDLFSEKYVAFPYTGGENQGIFSRNPQEAARLLYFMILNSTSKFGLENAKSPIKKALENKKKNTEVIKKFVNQGTKAGDFEKLLTYQPPVKSNFSPPPPQQVFSLEKADVDALMDWRKGNYDHVFPNDAAFEQYGRYMGHVSNMNRDAQPFLSNPPIKFSHRTSNQFSWNTPGYRFAKDLMFIGGILEGKRPDYLLHDIPEDVRDSQFTFMLTIIQPMCKRKLAQMCAGIEDNHGKQLELAKKAYDFKKPKKQP